MASPALANCAFNHVGITVPDMDTAISWYGEKLGATVLDRWSNPDAGMEWAHLKLGDLVIELVRMPSLATATERVYGLHHFAITVADCDEAVKQLEAQGVEVVRVPSDFERHAIRWAFVKDHLGNVIEIISPLVAAQ